MHEAGWMLPVGYMHTGRRDVRRAHSYLKAHSCSTRPRSVPAKAEVCMLHELADEDLAYGLAFVERARS